MESYSDMSLRLAKGGARMPISIDVGNAHSWAASLWRFMAQSQAYCSFHRWSGECGQSFWRFDNHAHTPSIAADLQAPAWASPFAVRAGAAATPDGTPAAFGVIR
jgi:hypothetical protein